MFPANDIVCNLLQTPFNRWKEADKRDVLNHGRPKDSLEIVAKKENKKTGKSHNVHFKNSWFDDYKWLCSSTTLKKLYCWPCLLFSNKNSAWNKEGFSDLLNITRSLHRHHDSAEHLKCEISLRNILKNQNTISDALKENSRLFKIRFNENVRLNRLFLHTVIDAVLFLSKQELAFRGHNESTNSINRGNFKELLSLLIARSPVEIQNQYEKVKNVFSGDSKIIQNELIQCISDYIDEHVIKEINESQFFSIQVDDTTDISQTSQCSLIIRFINSEGKLVERFLGFQDVSEDRTSENLYRVIDEILHKFNYEQKLIGQCYDGASVMSGHLNGLQKKIKDKAPQAVFVHCLAHRLNLVLQQSFLKITKCRIFFASISGIPSFFHHSGKRSYALTSSGARRIPSNAETRWSSHSKILNVIVEDWDKLKEVFEMLINNEQSDSKTINTARGFLNDMNNFEFTFLAIVFNEIFGHTDLLFEILQKKSLNICYCVSQIQKTTDILKSKRNDPHFEKLFKRANDITDVNFSKRNCDVSEDSYKRLYFEILDHILMEMDTRFQDCGKLQFICLSDTSKFKDFDSCFPAKEFESLKTFYSNIFTKVQRLKNELSLIYADENLRNISNQELIQELHEQRDIFTEAYKLFSLIATLPSTSVSVERSFSCLNRIKTYSRNTISEERLSSLANISIQKEFLLMLIKKQPFYDDIIDKFASLKGRRIDLEYKV